MAIGSLRPAFAPARDVPLAVKPACPVTGPGRFPSGLSRPLNSSITLWEDDAPSKLPARHGLRRVWSRRVRIECPPEWYFTDGSARSENRASSLPTYATQKDIRPNTKLQ